MHDLALALVLTCTLCAATARTLPRTHARSEEQVHDSSNPLRAVATLLVKRHSAAAFQPSNPGGQPWAIPHGSTWAARRSRLRHRALAVMNENEDSADSNQEKPLSASPKVSAPPGFSQPEPQPLTVTGDIGGALSGTLALAFRLASGVCVQGWSPFGSNADDAAATTDKYTLSVGPLTIRDDSAILRGECARPSQPLVLYEYEASPFCRKVREAIGILDLTVVYKPCPGARAGFSDELFERTGRRTVPYLIDPNNGKEMFESDDIINYLFNTYGPGEDQVPILLQGGLALFSCTFAALARGMAGAQRQPDARPDNEQMQPIEIWGYEASPFVKPVREKLCALALPHKMVSAARGSANRDALFSKTGRFQVPYIVDPNTGVEMFESIEIVKYLDQVYTTR